MFEDNFLLFMSKGFLRKTQYQCVVVPIFKGLEKVRKQLNGSNTVALRTWWR